MSAKIGIVILNYMNYKDTAECVACALKQTYSNYEIIVVDNGSTNQSYAVLKFLFGDYPQVTILKSNKNLGFARGNNLGIRYAREKCRADYVFVCNSDVLFRQDLFESIISADAPGIGVISPTVYLTDGNFQPYTVAANNIYYKILQTIRDIILVWISFLPMVGRLKEELKPEDSVSSHPSDRLKGKRCNYVLQGCAYVLTPSFFDYYKQLYPKTFLYWEEINLLVYIKKAKLSSVTADTSPVIHKDQGSAKILFRNQSIKRKRLWISTISMVKSLPMFFMRYQTIKSKYN